MLNNLREVCERYRVSREDFDLACDIVVTPYRTADLVIAPDGEPYLYRWHVIPQNKRANCYFHIQVKSDPERPLHDHPWDNTSVILAGGYDEHIAYRPAKFNERYAIAHYARNVGETIPRSATWGHRLEMPDGIAYTMTLFTTGPHIRDWGFWYPHGWVSHRDVCVENGNISVHREIKP